MCSLLKEGITAIDRDQRTTEQERLGGHSEYSRFSLLASGGPSPRDGMSTL